MPDYDTYIQDEPSKTYSSSTYFGNYSSKTTTASQHFSPNFSSYVTERARTLKTIPTSVKILVESLRQKHHDFHEEKVSQELETSQSK